MSNRNPAAQGIHNRMVATARDRLLGTGWINVKADHIGGPQPGPVCWEGGTCHIPDVEASKNGSKVLVEVETADSLTGTHAAEQCRLFGTYATQHGHEFVLAVPAGYEAQGQALLARAGVPGHGVVGL